MTYTFSPLRDTPCLLFSDGTTAASAAPRDRTGISVCKGERTLLTCRNASRARDLFLMRARLAFTSPDGRLRGMLHIHPFRKVELTYSEAGGEPVRFSFMRSGLFRRLKHWNFPSPGCELTLDGERGGSIACGGELHPLAALLAFIVWNSCVTMQDMGGDGD